jgi:hypothetical protein
MSELHVQRQSIAGRIFNAFCVQKKIEDLEDLLFTDLRPHSQKIPRRGD